MRTDPTLSPKDGLLKKEQVILRSPFNKHLLNTYICWEIFPALVRQMNSPVTCTNSLYFLGVNRYTDISKVL